MKTCFVHTALLAAALVSPTAFAEEYDGAELYMVNCSNCHGVYGEGDGIVAPDLAVALQDLRYIQLRNDGKFPRRVIKEIIDGRERRMVHGLDGMPVWGNAFLHSEGHSEAAEERVRKKIDTLVEFVESIQISGS